MRLFSPLNFDLYTRYYFLPCNRCSFNIEKASVQILLNVYFEENIELIESMLLVEWLTGVRPYIKTIKFVSLGLKHGKKRYNKGLSYSLQVVVCSTVRNDNLLSLLNFLYVSFVSLKDKYLSNRLYVDNIGLNFIFLEYDFFVSKPNYISSFRPVKFNLFSNLAKVSLSGSFSKLIYKHFIRDFWSSYSEFNLVSWRWRV